MSKEILGHIDCPVCGAANGMRITHDKNSHPFGYCEADCGQQMRVGPSPRRIKKFTDRYPWAGTVSDTGQKPAPEPAKPPVTVPEPEQTPAPKRKATFVDALAVLGVR
jgi:hypothetical protein